MLYLYSIDNSCCALKIMIQYSSLKVTARSCILIIFMLDYITVVKMVNKRII